MKRALIAGGVLAALLVLLVLAVRDRGPGQDAEPAAATSPAVTPSPAEEPAEGERAAAEAHPGFLYGRITTVDGTTYEGRLRWGGGEEALWGHYFNGFKDGNPWVAHVPPERLPEERRRFEIFVCSICTALVCRSAFTPRSVAVDGATEESGSTRLG